MPPQVAPPVSGLLLPATRRGRHSLSGHVTRYRTSFDTDEQAVVEALFLGLMAPGESELPQPPSSRRSLLPAWMRRRWKCARRPRSSALSSMRSGD